MKTVPSAYERMKAPCFVFRWIGQPWTSCDECGRPFWEHSHEEKADMKGGPFGGGRWKHVIIKTVYAQYIKDNFVKGGGWNEELDHAVVAPRHLGS